MEKILFKYNGLLIFFIITLNTSLTTQMEIKRKKMSSSNNTYHSFCGVNTLKSNIFQNSSPPKKLNIHTSNLSSKIFTPVRIFLDTKFLDSQTEYRQNESIYSKIKSALNHAVKAISEIIKVEQYEENVFIDGLTAENIQGQGLEIWDESLNNLEYVHNNYDYILFAKFNEFNDYSITAAANPFYLAQETNRPLIGIIQITPYLEDKYHLEEYLKEVFLHELFHAFGFLNEAFQYFPGGREASVFTEIGVAGIERTYVKTPKVLDFAKKYFGCESIKGVELENQGLGGSKNNHWDSRILLGELMTSEQYEDEAALSEFTLAFLEDSGWYQVNYYTGGLMRFGKNRGCDFLNEYCIKGNVTDFPNEFYDYNVTSLGHPSCTSGRLSRAYFNLIRYDLPNNDSYHNLLPKIDDKYIGGFIPSADYCPVSYKSVDEGENGFLVGNCKYGTGDYGSEIKYINTTTNIYYKGYPNGYLYDDFGEAYSNNSFCMMNDLVPYYISSDISNVYNIYGTVYHPMCFPSFCSLKSLTVQIYDRFVVCPRQGGNIEVEGYTGKLLCPDYNLICTGTEMCNDLYDCIEKKSLLKEESLIYDYIPIITQRYSELKITETLIAWENDINGICPVNCSQCFRNKKCFVCKPGLNLIGENENDDNPIICDDNKINIENGYYLNNEDGVYYKCHNNCLKCSDKPLSDVSMNCIQCKVGFYFNDTNNNCYEIISEEKNDDNDDSTTWITIVSAVAGVVVASGGTTVIIYIRKKKKQDEQVADAASNLLGDKREISMTDLSGQSKKEI